MWKFLLFMKIGYDHKDNVTNWGVLTRSADNILLLNISNLISHQQIVLCCREKMIWGVFLQAMKFDEPMD